MVVFVFAVFASSLRPRLCVVVFDSLFAFGFVFDIDFELCFTLRCLSNAILSIRPQLCLIDGV